MAKLTTMARAKLPAKKFALPGAKKFPIPDRPHAINAKARASQAVNAGRMAPSTEKMIDAKANKVIGVPKDMDLMQGQTHVGGVKGHMKYT